MYHVIGLKVTRGIKNVGFKAGKNREYRCTSTGIRLIQQVRLVTIHTNKQI